jgi:hypothetical protein
MHVSSDGIPGGEEERVARWSRRDGAPFGSTVCVNCGTAAHCRFTATNEHRGSYGGVSSRSSRGDSTVNRAPPWVMMAAGCAAPTHSAEATPQPINAEVVINATKLPIVMGPQSILDTIPGGCNRRTNWKRSDVKDMQWARPDSASGSD